VEGVFPILEAALGDGSDPVRARFIRLALEDTDRRVADGRAVAPSFLLACLLWHDVQSRWKALREGGASSFPALQDAVQAVFDARIGDISGRGKLAADMREIWQMQPRFERRTVASVDALVEQPRFRAGYDFLRLRSDVGEVPAELADWWEDYSLGSDEEREALRQELKIAQTRRVQGPREAARPPGAAPGAEPAPSAEERGPDGPARRRRRRRRGGRSGSSDSATPGTGEP
jgi:poly(A) polymerase